MKDKHSNSFFVLLLFGLIVAASARGGVDQGNPKLSKYSVYNLVHNYRIKVNGVWEVDRITNPDVVRIDVVSTYRKLGHFEVVLADNTRPSSCTSRKILGTRLALFWIGVDCRHPFFTREFETIYESIEPVAFN